jgi:hypothetical protein
MSKVIENWFTKPGGNGFTAPEVAGITICGMLDGKLIRTSTVRSFQGRTVVTNSGTVYHLGQIDSEFLDHLKANNYPFDPENPIRLVNKLTELK